MEERQASIDGTTYRMGELYTILATQNPVEQEGTYKLPEAQLDRFLMKITMGYPSLEEEVDVLERHHAQCFVGEVGEPGARAHKEELLSLRRLMEHCVCRPHAASVHRVDCTADAYQQGCIFRSFSACVRGNDAGLQGICTVAGT